MADKKNTANAEEKKNEKNDGDGGSREIKKIKAKGPPDATKEKPENNVQSKKVEPETPTMPWTREMRCTEVMLPKSILQSAPPVPKEAKDSTIFGALINQEKVADDEKTKTLTSFADLTWKPQKEQFQNPEISAEDRKVIAEVIKKVRANLPSQKLLPSPSSPDAAAMQATENAQTFPPKHSVQSETTRKDMAQSKPSKPIPQFEKRPSLDTNDGPVINTKMFDEFNLDAPIPSDKLKTWEMAKTSDGMQEYKQKYKFGYHKTVAFRMDRDVSSNQNLDEVQNLHPKTMFLPQWQRKTAVPVNNNDLMELARGRWARSTNESPLNPWLKRLLVEAVGIEERFAGNEESEEDETAAKHVYPKCEKEEIIKDAIRAMLYAIDFMLNFLELFMYEHCNSGSETYKSTLQQLMHICITNFLQDGTVTNLSEVCRTRGNNEQLIGFLIARVLEWVDILNERNKPIPDNIPIPKGMALTTGTDSLTLSEKYVRHYLPSVLEANHLYSEALLSTLPDINIRRSFSASTPLWIAEEIRLVSKMNQIGHSGSAHSRFPFLRNVNDGQMVKKFSSNRPDFNFYDMMQCPVEKSETKKKDPKQKPKQQEVAESKQTLKPKEIPELAAKVVIRPVPSFFTVGEQQQVVDKQSDSGIQDKPVSVETDNKIKKTVATKAAAETVVKSATKKTETQRSPPNDSSKSELSVSLRDATVGKGNTVEENLTSKKTAPSPEKQDTLNSPINTTKNNSDELLQWAADTEAKYDQLRSLPTVEREKQRDRFIREQGELLKRYREKWKARVQRMEAVVNCDQEAMDFRQVNEGMAEKAIFKTDPIGLAGQKRKKPTNETDDKSQMSFLTALWNYFSKKTLGNAKDVSAGSQGNTIKGSPAPSTVLDAKQGMSSGHNPVIAVPQGKTPTQQEINHFINQLTRGVGHSQYLALTEEQNKSKKHFN